MVANELTSAMQFIAPTATVMYNPVQSQWIGHKEHAKWTKPAAATTTTTKINDQQ